MMFATPKKVEAELMRFFGANRPVDIEVLPHAAKKTAPSFPPDACSVGVALPGEANREGNACCDIFIGCGETCAYAPETSHDIAGWSCRRS